MKEKKVKISRSILGILFILLIWSCDGNRIIDQNIELINNDWGVNDVKSFKFDIIDTSSLYNVYINVRNNSEYAYRNLYLFMELNSPSNKYFADTVEISLADKKGKWLGSGIGNIWQNQIALLRGVRMLESGTYSINVKHGMRHDTLHSITDIGVRVEIDDETARR